MNHTVRESEALRALGAESLIGSGHEDDVTELAGPALPVEDTELLQSIGSLRCMMPAGIPLRLLPGGVTEPRMGGAR